MAKEIKYGSEATLWTYTNLHQNKTKKQNREVNCQSIWTYVNLHSMILGKQMPHHRDLQ